MDITNPGADLDAVEVRKPAGTRHYATKVENYHPVNVADIAALNAIPDNILGEPTAFDTPFDPANASPDKDCDLGDDHYVTLGGVGGYIIVSFGNSPVENGDTITVYEVGNCANGGKLDPVEVQVSVASAADGTWEPVFSDAAGPAMSGYVENLPEKISP